MMIVGLYKDYVTVKKVSQKSDIDNQPLSLSMTMKVLILRF